MKHKTLFLVIAVISVYLLSGCSHLNKSETKTVKASQFTDLVFDDRALLPNNEFTWSMSKEDFLSKIYRADIFDPDSETFNEYRYFHSEETNITTFTPMITYQVGSIPGEAEVIYAFDTDGLFKSGYVWNFKEGEGEKAEKAVEALVHDFNTNQNIVENPIAVPDFLSEDTAAFPYQYQWSLADSQKGYIELGISKMRESILVQITVGIL